MRTVLIVDDKEMMRDSVASTLQRAGFSIQTAPDGQSGLDALAKKRPDAVVTDMKMPGLSGLEMLERIRQVDDELPVILMTAFGTIETAVQAMRLGAFDYLTKPFEGDELIISVKRAIEHRRLIRENAVLRSGGEARAAGRDASHGLDRLIGQSRVMAELREQVKAVAGTKGTVLITGESGSGKEVVARALHDMSSRKDGPLLAVNCAALSESLLESELFGHERGAFTGADRLRKGRFELADGGTLLLDEVSEIPPQIQAKLLRVLQEQAFERVGSSLTIGIDVRVVATSNRDLPASVGKSEFRQDLYYRLNVLPVVVPPLRARAEDVPMLAEHFVAQVSARDGREPVRIDAGAHDLLRAYSWPGNVRELQNICERAMVLSAARGEGAIHRSLVEPWLRGGAMPVAGAAQVIEPKPAHAANGTCHTTVAVQPLSSMICVDDRKLEDIEREAIVMALGRYKGHRQKTARALGIGVRTLGLKLKKWKDQKLVDAGL